MASNKTSNQQSINNKKSAAVFRILVYVVAKFSEFSPLSHQILAMSMPLLQQIVIVRQLTVSLASWLLAAHRDHLASPEIEYLEQAVDAHLKHSSPLPMVPPIADSRKDPDCNTLDLRYSDIMLGSVQIKVYTDYTLAKDMLGSVANVSFVDDQKDSDFLLLTKNVYNFSSLPRGTRVSQFPYEGGIVQKDLLPLTVRRYCYDGEGNPPSWWLPCFDLSTEFHIFARDFKRRIHEGFVNVDGAECSYDTNIWIIKPAKGSRGRGHRVVNGTLVDNTLADIDDFIAQRLKTAAMSAPQMYIVASSAKDAGADISYAGPREVKAANEADFVAQRYVARPLLIQKRKFDVRVFVFVRSFVPFEAYMHEFLFARLANKIHDLGCLEDDEVILTVSAYSDDAQKAGKQTRLNRQQLKTALMMEYGLGLGGGSESKQGQPSPGLESSGSDRRGGPGFDWEDFLTCTRCLCSELFRGIAPSIGHWPRSSAYYSLDIMYEMLSDEVVTAPTTDSNYCSADVDDNQARGGFGRLPYLARLLEVNFCGDWAGVLAAAQNEEESRQWALDLLQCLATRLPVDATRHHAL